MLNIILDYVMHVIFGGKCVRNGDKNVATLQRIQQLKDDLLLQKQHQKGKHQR